jgi:hypothetical protein
MRDLVEEFQDIFRIRLDDSPHADVAPMGAEVQPDIKPSKAPPRHYNPGNLLSSRHIVTSF